MLNWWINRKWRDKLEKMLDAGMVVTLSKSQPNEYGPAAYRLVVHKGDTHLVTTVVDGLADAVAGAYDHIHQQGKIK